jgi:hypothetical protein
MPSKSLLIDGIVVYVIPLGILFIMSLAKIIYLVQHLIIPFNLFVMPVHVSRLTNYHIQSLLVDHLLLWSTFSLMCGGLQLKILDVKKYCLIY